MDTDTRDKQVNPDADANDPYNREFAALTSPEHYAQDATPGEYGEGSKSSFYNPGGDAKADSPSTIKNLENNPKGAATTEATEASGAEASFFTGGPPGSKEGFLRGRLTKRKGITGGIIGLVLGGGIFFGVSIVSGPFQFIHLAQLLQQFHLNEQSDETDDRTGKLVRYWRYARTGRVENTRLGIFANKVASNVETNLNASGIESAYTDKFGLFNGYVIDTENPNFKGKTNDEIKQYFKETYNIDLTEGTGKLEGRLVASNAKMGYFAQRKLIGAMLKETGYGGVSGAIRARIMGKRAGITWHPIKKLDSKILNTAEKKIKAWREDKTSEIDNGTEANIALESTPDENGDNNQNAQSEQNASSTKGEADGDNSDAKSAGTATDGGDPDAIKGLQGKLSLKLTGGAAALAGVACMAKGLADNADQVKQAQVIMPLMRMGMREVAIGNEVMSGSSDIDLDQLGYESQTLFDSSNPDPAQRSWSNAASIQAELGNSQTGVAADNTLNTITKGTPFDFLKQGAIGTTLGGVCSGVGQAVTTVISFLGGPVSTLVGLGLGPALSPVMSDLAHWLAGKAVDPNIAGAQLGNYANYGVKMAANEEAVSAGGRKLTNTEVAQLETEQASETKSTFEHQNIAYRLFSPYDSQSLFGSIIDSQNANVSANASQVASSFLHVGSSLLSLPSKLFTKPVSAATTGGYDYGFPTYGFSETELNDPNLQNPYQNADYVLDSGLLSQYSGRINSCFGVTVDDSGNVQGAPNANQITDVYSSDYDKNGDCSDTSENWLRVRMYIFDSETADSMSCFQGDNTACDNVGFGDNSAATSDTAATGSPVAASGSAQQLATQLLADKNLTGASGVTQDLTATSQGKTINNSDSCGNTITLDPDLLQVILTTTTKYKLYLDNIVTGHGCDEFLHPKGRASDIGTATDLATNKSTDFTPGANGDDLQLDHDFYIYLASILPKGGEMGQDECTGRTGITAPPGITFFSDTCNHQHFDMGNP